MPPRKPLLRGGLFRIPKDLKCIERREAGIQSGYVRVARRSGTITMPAKNNGALAALVGSLARHGYTSPSPRR